MEQNLRIPGPTPLPPSALQASARQMIDHRGPEFARMQQEIIAGLKPLFRTENDIILLTASGTGGLEAAIVNLFSPGEQVLAISIGSFGERFAKIAQAYQLDVVPVRFPWGETADPTVVDQVLQEHPQAKGVLVTHNETSTGLTNNLAALSKVISKYKVLFLVDSISGVGAIEMRVDDWDIDVMVTGSQKAWMAPPGVAMVTVSPQAWAATRLSRLPRFYFDFAHYEEWMAKGQTPWTPATSVYYALQNGIKLIESEGLEKVLIRHQRVADYTRQEARRLGLQLFGKPGTGFYSNTVAAISVPETLDGDAIRKRLREEYNIVLGGGLGKLKGKIVRIGHMGWVEESHIAPVFSALQEVLARAQV
ncbi:MAG: alanine--glyoxylate aminotransferase family protein [Chloroflexi bacterium]|nr:alanine--glyoxylate aminotransferase family protein [Chloroflexota bacterium]